MANKKKNQIFCRRDAVWHYFIANSSRQQLYFLSTFILIVNVNNRRSF